MTRPATQPTDQPGAEPHPGEARHRAPRPSRDLRTARTGPFPRALVAAITIVWLGVLLTWTFVLPTYRSADEPAQVSATLSLRYGMDWPGYKQLPIVTNVSKTRSIAGHTDADGQYYPLAREDVVPRATRPPFVVDGEVTTSGTNNLGQHPPGYYALTAAASHLTPESTAFDLHVWLLRLVNVLLITPLPWLMALTVHRLGADRAGIAVGAATPLLVPQLGALGGAVNNENLAILTGVAMSYLITRVGTGDQRRRTAVLLGLVLAVGLLAKAWALLFIPVICLGYLLGAARTRRWGRALGGLVTTGALSLLGAWWWVRNYLVFGAVQPAGHLPSRDVPLDPAAALPRFVSAVAEYVPTRFWAMLSIKHEEAPFPYAVTWALTVVLLVGLLVLVVRRQSYSARRADGLLLALPFVALIAVLMYSTWSLFLDTGFARGLQGRYLFTGIAAVAGAFGLGLMGTLRGKLRQVAALVIVGGGLAFTGLSFVKALEHHWAGETLMGRLESLGAWSATPPAVTLACFAVLPLGVVLLIVAGWWGARSSAPATDADAPAGAGSGGSPARDE
ncbi:hypothetical protein [Actinotalea sp. C106]|uniref:hypothetical protein n=1 Tax=Actinotalea sp. C106 TaxID=2908644 RepID=UPI002027CA32|nr:hypothetical protein [Actinotalea sp. C106]